MSLLTDVKKSDEEIITIELLSRAIRNGMSGKNKRLSYREAIDTAEHVLNFFGYNQRIIDNMLEPEDRDAFYMLEDIGILTTEREEITLFDGREWRIHYWLFKTPIIMKLLQDYSEDIIQEKESASEIYDEIPDDVWNRSAE